MFLKGLFCVFVGMSLLTMAVAAPTGMFMGSAEATPAQRVASSGGSTSSGRTHYSFVGFFGGK